MENFFRKSSFEIKKFSYMYKELEVSAHAAAASFYLFLSLIPLIALILTIIPYTPLTELQVNRFLSLLLPIQLDSFINAVTVQMYGQGPFFLFASAIFLLWSAGKGMQSITRGLNAVNGVKHEKRNFFLLRMEACIYTILLVLFLLSTILVTFSGKFVLTRLMTIFHIDLEFYIGLLDNRYLFEWVAFSVFFCIMYGWIPYRKRLPHKMWRGGLFAGITCTLFSWIYSIYLNNFHGFSLYGSMAVIVVTMVWIFIIMTLFFAGALINVYFEQFIEVKHNNRVKGQTIHEKEVLIRDIDRYGVEKKKRRPGRKRGKEEGA